MPDLKEIIALPQDEMADIVQRFRGNPAVARGGNAAGTGTDASYYNDWLAALKTLDFDQLTRNAQVDYLYLKKRAELELARLDKPLPANNPRKTDNSGIPGAARGREGLIRDLEDELIPYTPEQLIVLADREFAWHEAEMRKASREMGFGDDWKKALEKTKTMHPPPGGQPAMIRDLLFEAVDYVRAHDLVTVPQVERRIAAHDHDDARTAAGESVLHRRRPDERVVPDEHDGVRGAAAEHARQQPSVVARDGVSRNDPRSQPVEYLRPALQRLSLRASAAARSSAKAGRCTGS